MVLINIIVCKMNNKILFLPVILILFVSCGTPRDVAYFQDTGSYTSIKDSSKHEVRLQKNDILGITVNSSDSPEAALPFNQPLANFYIGSDNGYGQPRVLGYLVDEDGNIEFPVLGKIRVEGRTRSGLRDLIKKLLIDDGQLQNPIVTVNILNFTISVYGEVNRPNTFNITGERVTLLEALSMAGDLTIHGRRDRVKVYREINGKKEFINNDLRSSSIINSPSFYLQQNDVVYVEPNKRRKQQSNINQNNNVGVWLSIVSVLLTATSIIVSVSK